MSLTSSAAPPDAAASDLAAGVAGWCCRLSADLEQGRGRLLELLGGLKVDARPAADTIEVFLRGDLPRLRVRRGATAYSLPQMLSAPGWERLEASPEGGPVFVDTILRGDPVIRDLGEEVAILRPDLWPLYVVLAFVWLAQATRRVVTLHCAVCAVGDTALVLMGPSGTGKSTLCWALHDAGADYYGDELAFVDLAGFRLTPWTRFLNLRPGGVAQLQTPPEISLWRSLKENDPKAPIHLSRPARPCPADRAAFVLLDGFGEEPELAPMRGGEAVRRIFLGMGCAERSVARRLSVAADIAQRYPAYRLTVGKPEPTALLLLQRFSGA